MTEHKETKDREPSDPRNQAAAQIGNPDAGPGEPGHYNPPDPNVGVTRSKPNEVLTPEMIEKAEEIPDTRADWDKRHEAGHGKTHGKAQDTDYESLTVPELKELAQQRGIEAHSDWLKDDYIKALKKS